MPDHLASAWSDIQSAASYPQHTWAHGYLTDRAIRHLMVASYPPVPAPESAPHAAVLTTN